MVGVWILLGRTAETDEDLFTYGEPPERVEWLAVFLKSPIE